MSHMLVDDPKPIASSGHDKGIVDLTQGRRSSSEAMVGHVENRALRECSMRMRDLQFQTRRRAVPAGLGCGIDRNSGRQNQSLWGGGLFRPQLKFGECHVDGGGGAMSSVGGMSE